MTRGLDVIKPVIKAPKVNREDPMKGNRPPENIGCLFLDSGAHSLFNKHVDGKSKATRYDFFETDAFWEYVDAYALFLKENKHAIDMYVNVDVIFNPEMSWKVQRYLEDTHDLTPVPVVHMNTDAKWLKRYLKRGYDLIGLGGVAREGTRTSYFSWADEMFNIICDTPNRLPSVRVHGFAMTAYSTLLRYPWWSVDSASWTKAAAFGIIYVPQRVHGKFQFHVDPYQISCSADSPSASKRGQNFSTIPRVAQKIVEEWLAQIDVPIGKQAPDGTMLEWGVTSHHAARKIANLRFFEALRETLPDWPWAFKIATRGSLGLLP